MSGFPPNWPGPVYLAEDGRVWSVGPVYLTEDGRVWSVGPVAGCLVGGPVRPCVPRTSPPPKTYNFLNAFSSSNSSHDDEERIRSSSSDNLDLSLKL